MGLIYNLSLRNLFRQKKRNLLLGSGIAFGMMVLTIANSFSHGMMEAFIKDVVTNTFGHLMIEGMISNNDYKIIWDKQRIEQIIYQTIPKEELLTVNENLETFGRAIGNGEADNVYLKGASVPDFKEKNHFFNSFFTLVKGDLTEYNKKDIKFPVVIPEEVAKSLNVTVHDVIRIRVSTVTGQVQTAQLTVVAIVNPSNSYMNTIIYMDSNRLKKLLGYEPWQTSTIQLTLKNPKQNANQYADLLFHKLQPVPLSIVGKINGREVKIYAFQNDKEAKALLNENLRVVNGDFETAVGKEGVMISQALARQLNLRVGEKFAFEYPTKYLGLHQENLSIDAIYDSDTSWGQNVILINGERIFQVYNKYLPRNQDLTLTGKGEPLYSALATGWRLLERSRNSQELQRKYKQERTSKTSQAKLNIVTMYEGASEILQIESLLSLLTFIAVTVIFFIILVGVINTLRMTIRERTREIGTVRAIGMQKRDVRNMFILETLLLSSISCIAGIIVGVIIMQILGLITFDTSNALSMILKNKHLCFMLDPGGLFLNFILIMGISALTAYFPARRAAKLTAAEALRHYE